MPDDHSRLPITYLAVLAAAVLCYAALGAVLSILPRYVPQQLGGGPTAVGLMVGAPALTALLARPLGGRLADRLGPLTLLLATALGGAAHATAVLWVSVVLPLLGGAAAVLAHRGDRAVAGDGPGGTASTRTLLRRTAPAGLGLLAVNVGYVSLLSFGAAVERAHGTGLATLVVPVFALAVIASRTVGGGVPDRLGGRRTVVTFAGAEAVGLLVYANAVPVPIALLALLALSVGQALAVPGPGLLALAGVAPENQGAAAGLFFAWFDAGVGLGGLAVGAAASLVGTAGAVEVAAAAVSGAVVIALVVGRRRSPSPRRSQLRPAQQANQSGV